MQGSDIQYQSWQRERSGENHLLGQDEVLGKARVSDTSYRSGSRCKKSRIRNAQDYVDAVTAHSRLTAVDSLCPGQHLTILASFLGKPFERRAPNVTLVQQEQQSKDNYEFVAIHNLDPASGKRVKHLDSITEFESEASILLANSGVGHLLFMKGYPSPNWLSSIGATYRIDPEFFQRHLDFRHMSQDHFLTPSLPSASSSMVKLRITTIGETRPGGSTSHSQEKLEYFRTRNERSLSAYIETLRSGSGPRLGDSIVRQCSLHDMQHFSIEQDISIYVVKKDASWVGFVWVDNGRDLSHNILPWLTSPFGTSQWKTRFLPVVQHWFNVSLKSPSSLKWPPRRDEMGNGKIPQSASLLHLDYGRFLDRGIAAIDPFYALQDLFNFAAASENQFLNMIGSKLQQELDLNVLIQPRSPTLSNLLCTQRNLDRRVQRIQENLDFIRAWSRREWFRGSLDSTQQSKADKSADKVARDFEYLLGRAKALHEQCTKGMQIVMNNANVKEAREAMSQAEVVAKLTRLAFIFVPMSFTSSFFGMNFVQFGTGRLGLWVWFVVTVPVLTLALVFMHYDIQVLARKRFSYPIKFIRRMYEKIEAGLHS
ncbi:hypothetical protein EV356DRAFT_534509 [Viridothelium virens]|uniref:Cora-domain-containing protein n=1 Tax=Viridothelium virens TaxID=1048519 RepID=A0A6A6H4D2_VIRVR|nr:hypothetical protein EV356DRAFT_534509 [Viridothelium virens]